MAHRRQGWWSGCCCGWGSLCHRRTVTWAAIIFVQCPRPWFFHIIIFILLLQRIEQIALICVTALKKWPFYTRQEVAPLWVSWKESIQMLNFDNRSFRSIDSYSKLMLSLVVLLQSYKWRKKHYFLVLHNGLASKKIGDFRLFLAFFWMEGRLQRDQHEENPFILWGN